MITKLHRRRFLVFALAIFATAASQLAVPRASAEDKISQLIKSIPKIDVPPNKDLLVATASEGFEGKWDQRVELIKSSYQMAQTLEGLVAFNPNADSLYPGALVQGQNLPHGTLNPISAKRTPVNISITDFVASPGASYSMTIKEPSLSSIHDGVQKLLDQNLNADQPAKLSFNKTTIYSVEEGFLRLGASAEWMSGHVSGSLSTSSTKKMSRYLVRFIQSYFTVAVEAPASPSSYFTPSQSVAELKNYIAPGNPPCYVASVTYGRELWMLIESLADANSLETTLNAAFSSGFIGGSVQLDAGQKAILEQSNMQVLALGGSGAPAVNLITHDKESGLAQYLKAGANFSKSSPGVIISYTVRYLLDNDIARVSSSTNYDVHTQHPSPEPIPLTRAVIAFHTNGDDKDGDTHVLVVIRKKGADPATNMAAIVGSNFGHFDNGTDSGEAAMTLTGSSLKSDFTQGGLEMHIDPNGNDTWEFNIGMRLEFADGSTITNGGSGLSLSESHRDWAVYWH